MNDNDYRSAWISIIAKIYKNLHTSSRVMNISKESDKKAERLLKYFHRLEIVHEKVTKSKKDSDLNLLKSFYYDNYIIKEEDIPESYYQNQARIYKERGYGNIEITDRLRKKYAEQIIQDQKSSLDKWIEYFLYDDESKSYEMWEKYWVFQGIKNLGKYNKETGKFQKRENETVYPFIQVDRELIFNTLKLMEDYLKNKKREDEIASALGSGNFKQLYEYSIKLKLTKGEIKNYGVEGKWIKYDQGSDYNILRDSIQGYYTGWCTAAGENFAKNQLAEGDFYVYYSLDSYNDPKIPRIAIRMHGNDVISEIRGIADNQNMEEEMLPILEEKLKDFKNVDIYYKKEEDMKKLTIISKKMQFNENLSTSELNFLYEIEEEIEGFGYEKDPRIEEIKSKRNLKEDYSKIIGIDKNEIALSEEEYFLNPSKYKAFIGFFNLRELEITKGLEFPKYLFGDLDLKKLKSAKGLKLPKIIKGYLNVDSLTSAEGLELPETVGGDLCMRGLTSAKGLKLPKNVGGIIYLIGLTNVDYLEFPETIKGDLDLKDLKSTKGLDLSKMTEGYISIKLESAEGLKLPKEMNGYLQLSNLKSAKGLYLPQIINGTLELYGFTSTKYLVLPKIIGEDLYLDSLKNAKGLELPESIGGDLNLSDLENADGLKMPNFMGGTIYLNSLTNIVNTRFPKTVNGDLVLNSLTTSKGLELPETIIGSLYLNGLISAKKLKLPKNIGGHLFLSNLNSLEGLYLPSGFDISKLHVNNTLDYKIKNNHLTYCSLYVEEKEEVNKRVK